MKAPNLTRRGTAFLVACVCASVAGAADVRNNANGGASAPIKIAMFDVELADFSAGGPLAGQSPEETARISLTSKKIRELLKKSSRYELVDVSADHPEISVARLSKTERRLFVSLN